MSADELYEQVPVSRNAYPPQTDQLINDAQWAALYNVLRGTLYNAFVAARAENAEEASYPGLRAKCIPLISQHALIKWITRGMINVTAKGPRVAKDDESEPASMEMRAEIIRDAQSMIVIYERELRTFLTDNDLIEEDIFCKNDQAKYSRIGRLGSVKKDDYDFFRNY
jgi:hypothetical protein